MRILFIFIIEYCILFIYIILKDLKKNVVVIDLFLKICVDYGNVVFYVQMIWGKLDNVR